MTGERATQRVRCMYKTKEMTLVETGRESKEKYLKNQNGNKESDSEEKKGGTRYSEKNQSCKFWLLWFAGGFHGVHP